LALDDVSFQVHPGEIVAQLGPNGAGKTTASRIIGGILAPSEGDVLVDGVSVRKDANTVRARCGFVTDQPSLYERMPLRRYLGFFARRYDVADPDVRAAGLAKLRGLDGVLNRRLATFSRGMRQKVAIARALVHDPPVLLLDEPATALDPEMSQMLRAFIISLRARHRAILLTTHDLDEAQRIADRVVVLYKGKVLRTGATADVRAAGRPSYTVAFAGDPVIAREALARPGIPAEKENGTLVPLLAAPIRDFDIVLGKLIGMVVPVMVACVVTLAAGYALAAYRYGAARVAQVLTLELLYAIVVLALLYLVTTGSIT